MGKRMRVRSVFAGAIYHVYSRGVLRRPIFEDDRDRQRFMRLLAVAAGRLRLEVRSFCLMGNHVHLHVKTPLANLPDAMQRLLGTYARYFNERHDRSGHLFESRYFSPVVEPGYFEARLARYIHRNPVAAGMVSRPEDWPWSSCRAYLGLCATPSWLRPGAVLETLGGTPDETLRRHRGFLGLESDDPLSIAIPTFERSIAIGSQAFRVLHGDTDEEFERHLVGADLTSSFQTMERPPAERVIAVVSEVFLYSDLALPPRERPPHPARFGAALVLGALGGWNQKEIGVLLGGVGARTIGRYVVAGRRKFVAKDGFRRAVTRCLRLLGRPVPDDLDPAAWPGYLAAN